MATNYLAFCALCTLFVRLCMHTRLYSVYVHCSRQQAICADVLKLLHFLEWKVSGKRGGEGGGVMGRVKTVK